MHVEEHPRTSPTPREASRAMSHTCNKLPDERCDADGTEHFEALYDKDVVERENELRNFITKAIRLDSTVGHDMHTRPSLAAAPS